MTTIAQERSKLAALGVELRRREQWGAKRSYTDSRPVDEPATRVFVHITVTEPGNYLSFDRHAQAIEAIGISRFPNTGISYNRLFMAGTRAVYEGQPIGRRGAHTVNDFRRSTCSTSGCPGREGPLTAPSWNLNINARSYVYCANVHHSVPDHVVEDMARVIAADKLAGFITKGAEIHGHRCVSSKSCPGDKMWARMGELEKLVDRYLSTGLNGDDRMPLNADDLAKIRKVVQDELARSYTHIGPPKTTVSTRHGGRYAFLASTRAGQASAKADAILDAVKAMPGVDGDALAAKVAEAVERLDAETVAGQLQVTVRPEELPES